MPARVQPHRASAERLHLRPRRCACPCRRWAAAAAAEAARRADDRDIEQAVGLVGVGADRDAAAVGARVPDARHHERPLDPPPVDLDRVRARAQEEELHQDRDVVAHLAPGPPHPVRPVVDVGVEAAREHRGVEPRAPSSAVTRARSIVRVRPAEMTSAAVPGSSWGMPRCVAKSLPVPAGTMPSGTPRAREVLQGEVDRPVAARDHERVGAELDAPCGSGVDDSSALPPLISVTVWPSSRSRSVARVGGVRVHAGARGGVDDHRDVHGAHTTSAPGFMMPRGSSVRLTARRISTPRAPISGSR